MAFCGLCPFETVETSEVAMVQSCGKHDRILRAGCHLLVPCCLEEIVGKISLRQKELKCLLETKTKDNVFVNITLSVMYMVLQEKIYNAFYDLSNPEQQMTAYVYDCVRAALCDLNLNETFDSKDKIAQTIKSQLTEKVGKYGYMIINALVVDIDPDRKVKDAMNEINAASRAKEAATQRAEGEKMLKVKVAESQMEAQYLSGVGVAKQRKAIMEGLRQNVQGLSSELTGQGATYKDVMDLLVLTQYFDVLQEIGTKTNSRVVFTGEESAYTLGNLNSHAAFN